MKSVSGMANVLNEQWRVKSNTARPPSRQTIFPRLLSPISTLQLGRSRSVFLGSDTPTEVERDGREHLPPIRDVPEVVPKLDRDQIIVRPYMGGLVKSFERRAA